jgi:cysteine desulfurase
MNRLVYADNNATTRVDPEVFDAMCPFFCERYGNPSTVYSLGREAAQALRRAREQTAHLIGSHPDEVVFTSGGTESNNLAMRGARAAFPERKHWIATRVEHSSVLHLCQVLSREGYESTLLEVDANGAVDLEQLRESIRPDTALVSVLWANNETGVLSRVKEIGAIVRERGSLFHTDAVQAAGKVPIDLANLPIDLLSLSAHKLYGPKGVGALYLRRGKRFRPQTIGGDQEQSRRAGTENVPGIVGLGKAAELVLARREEDHERIRALRDRLERELCARVPGTIVNGGGAPRLDNTLNLCFEGIEGEAILQILDEKGICVSSGSACASHSVEPSHVLVAMGVPENLARGALRISLGRWNSEEDIDSILEVLPKAVERLRGMR